MNTAVSSAVGEVEIATRFLTEFHSACSLLGLYGSEHPAFRQHAQTAAQSVRSSLQISISPDGFLCGQTAIADEELTPLARRLRSLGLISLSVETGLAAGDILGMILALQELEQGKAASDVLTDEIARRTRGKIKAECLRLSSLELISQTCEAAPDSQSRWEELFLRGESESDRSTIAELAEAFQRALGGSHSAAQWKAMVEAWLRELPAKPAADDVESKDDAASGRTAKLDAAAAFLQSLDPQLCKQLLAETFAHHTAPEALAESLAERLPTGAVLTAFSAASHASGGASAAALSLLGKWASQRPSPSKSAQAPSPTGKAPPAGPADALEKMLESSREKDFVPGDYLRRRSELSRSTTSGDNWGITLPWPGEHETTIHAAEMVFHILSTPNASPTHLQSALRFIRRRFESWVRSGEFAIAARALSLAHLLRLHEVAAVAELSEAVRSIALDVGHLAEGAGRQPNHEAGLEGLMDLLRQADGALLPRLLCCPALAAANTEDQIVIEAIARVLPTVSDAWVEETFGASGQQLPPGILVVLSAMSQSDALQVVQVMLPKAQAAARPSLVELISRTTARWPVPLIEWLLKDSDPQTRRLATMRLVRDADLARAANVLKDACKGGQFEPDVGLWLAELLHPHRRHPDVRAAFRQWAWCRRRWSALLFPVAQERRQAG